MYKGALKWFAIKRFYDNERLRVSADNLVTKVICRLGVFCAVDNTYPAPSIQ